MKIEVTLETLSGHAKTGTCGDIAVSVGDIVSAGEVILTVETGKGVREVVSPATGTVLSIAVSAGDTVRIGDLLITIEEDFADAAPKSSGDTKFSYSIGPKKPLDRTLECDIAIIGGGPGGYVAALQAAQMGASVVLVEKEELGGTCLNWGCIPTKALVRSAEVQSMIKDAERYGLAAGHHPVDVTRIVDRKNEIVRHLVQGIGYLLEKRGVTVLHGFGSLTAQHTVRVEETRYNTTLTAKNVILATGSSSCALPIPGMFSPNVMTSRDALALTALPQRMAIIGGGIIGMEFAFLFSKLGVDVAVIEYFDTILSVFDDDIIEVITAAAREAGIRLVTGAKVQSLVDNESGGSIVVYSKGEKEKYDLFETVLVAVGREACYDGLELDALGIELREDKKGILVDDTLKTTVDSVYAIGDVTNTIQLAHVASHQAVVAVKNIMGEACTIDYSAVPNAVFTAPEFAAVGISEKEASRNGIEVRVGHFPFSANGKALTYGESVGFVKLIEDAASGVLIGAAIVGPHATDMIGEPTLAIKHRLPAAAIAETIHAHPTCAEGIHEAALALGLGSLHFTE